MEQAELERLIVRAVGDERDPYPAYARKRATSPVESGTGMLGQPLYSLYRYRDINEALRTPEVYSSHAYVNQIGLVLGPSILQMDAPEHHKHRALIGGVFRRTALADWETSLIEPTVHALIDAFSTQGSAELVRELTIQFPIRIIAKLLGVPVKDFDKFLRLTIELISIMGDVSTGLRASAELREYFAGILAERRADPADDVISKLARAEIDGEPLPDEEIFGFLRLLLPAGAETTYRLLGNLLFALLHDPEQLDAVRAQRSLLPAAIEEALRWESPVQYIDRETTKPVEVAGVGIPAGVQVSMALGSANHDETVFDEPDRFDLFKERAPHLAFAEGPHRCLGEHLARLETTVAMNAVLDRLPDLRIDASAPESYVRGDAFRSPTALPVVFVRS